MENNKKAIWSHVLSGLTGFLGGIAVCILVMWVYNGNYASLDFQIQTVNRNVQVNSTKELTSWSYQFANLANYVDFNFPASVLLPKCTVKTTVVNPNYPGAISFNVSVVDPYPNAVPYKAVNQTTQVRCGLYNTVTNKFANIADINRYEGNFINVAAGNYKVICMSKLWKNPWYTARTCGTDDPVITISSMSVNSNSGVIPSGGNQNGGNNGGNVLTSAPGGNQNGGNLSGGAGNTNAGGINPGNTTSITQSSGQVNPHSQGGIDMELQAGIQLPSSANLPTTYFFKVGNNGQSSVSNSTLRVYTQGLKVVSAGGAGQSGTVYTFGIPVILANGGAVFMLEAFPDGLATPLVFAELCDYVNDVDSKACNMVNLGAQNAADQLNYAVVEDDEAKVQ